MSNSNKASGPGASPGGVIKQKRKRFRPMQYPPPESDRRREARMEYHERLFDPNCRMDWPEEE